MPLELLSDDPLQEPGLSDIRADSFEQDSAALEFNKAHDIREKARQLCMQTMAKDKVRLSSQGHLHRQRQWFPGQWVFVWRRFAGTGQGHVTRCRWTGPGLVLMQSGHTVWVSMRARLLKCNSDQLRPASRDEAIGAELQKSGDIKELLDQASSHRAGAVDVSSEGSPGHESCEQPIVPEEAPQVPLGTQPGLAPIAEEDEGEGQEAGAPQPLLRNISVPPTPAAQGAAPATPLPGAAPATPLPRVPIGAIRQVSQVTQDEPQIEPVPSISSASGLERASGRVKRQVSS